MTVVGVMAIAAITLTPASGSEKLPLWCLFCGDRPAVDFFLNVLLFMPVSVGMGLCGFGFRRALLYGVLASILVESLQFLVVAGRYPSGRDVLSNSSGVVIGYVMGRQWTELVVPGARRALALALAGATIWVATQLFSAWAMGMAAPPAPWWAQLTPEYDAYPAAFTGRIVALSIGSVPIVESDLIARGDDARRELLAGAPLRAVLAGAAPTRGRAMILVISAGPVRDVVYWEQDGRDALFTVPVRGTFVGLRTPSVRLADAIQRKLSDSVTLTGAYSHGRYRLTAERDGVVVSRELAASPSLTWAFLLPLPAYAFGAEVRLVTALWLAATWFLLGYWAKRAADRTFHIAAVIAIVATLSVGLWIAPMLFDVPTAHWSEWLAAVAGLGAGGLVARVSLRRAVAIPFESSGRGDFA